MEDEKKSMLDSDFLFLYEEYWLLNFHPEKIKVIKVWSIGEKKKSMTWLFFYPPGNYVAS